MKIYWILGNRRKLSPRPNLGLSPVRPGSPPASRLFRRLPRLPRNSITFWFYWISSIFDMVGTIPWNLEFTIFPVVTLGADSFHHFPFPQLQVRALKRYYFFTWIVSSISSLLSDIYFDILQELLSCKAARKICHFIGHSFILLSFL